MFLCPDSYRIGVKLTIPNSSCMACFYWLSKLFTFSFFLEKKETKVQGDLTTRFFCDNAKTLVSNDKKNRVHTKSPFATALSKTYQNKASVERCINIRLQQNTINIILMRIRWLSGLPLCSTELSEALECRKTNIKSAKSISLFLSYI